MKCALNSEYESRRRAAELSMPFGIGFLDDALNGNRPRDLTIVAAKTGCGKTELATTLALNAIRSDKRNKDRVVIFALEAEEDEILRRIKYQILARYFFEHRDEFPSTINLNFTDWLFCKLDSELEALEHKVSEEMQHTLSMLQIYTPTSVEFSKKDLAAVYEDYAMGTKLIVLDHLHYLSPEDREGEYDHIKKTMWQLRALINKHAVPVVAFSHLRKVSRRDETLIPNLEEIHGSSEIVKQANHVIGIAPAYEIPSKTDPETKIDLPVGSTFIRILKTRTGHAGSDRYAALVEFDIKSKSYSQKYIPYNIDRHGTSVHAMKYEDFERWMGDARESRA